MKKKKRGNGSPKFTKEQVRKTMLALQEKRLKKQNSNKEILRNVEQIKQKWIQDSKQWSKELKETIITNLFNS